MKKEKYKIDGMTCAACVSSVEKAACSLNGVKNASVSLMTNSLDIEYDENLLSEAEIKKAIKNKGYSAELYVTGKKDKGESTEIMRLRLIVSLIFLLPLMYIAMGKMMGLPVPKFITDNFTLYGALQFFLCLPIVLVNYKFFTVGFKRLIKLDPNMDSLIATGSAASIIYSIFAYIKIVFLNGEMGDYHLYIDSAGMILTLITLGKFLEARAKKKTSAALRGMAELSPEFATVLRDGKELTIPTRDLLVGDTVIMRPGQNLPADGIITAGHASVNMSVITGESIPAELDIGDEVSAGTTNLNSSFEFKVTEKGETTTLGKMIALVEDAAASKAPIARLADKVAAVFVPTVIAISIISTAAWLFVSHNIETALSVGISILVIACPCSLGLATPTAIMAGTGRGAEYGVLFKSAEALETLGKADTVILDKTGTITSGTLTVNHTIAFSGSEDELLLVAAALEARSEHPIASAICRSAEEKGLYPNLDFDRVEAMPGFGIFAKEDNNEYFIGNDAILKDNSHGLEINTYVEKTVNDLEKTGNTVVRVYKNGRVVGIIALSDLIRPDSSAAVEFMKKNGITPIMITGDNSFVAEDVARKTGILAFSANAKPQDKESSVRKLKSEGKKVVMIGDGVNDAPALASADIGVAIGSGTDIAIENSDVVLVGGRLGDFCNAISVSVSTMKIIRQNLFFAFFYNCIGIGLAVLGMASPMIGAAAMSLSSVSVVSNALRLRRIKLEKVQTHGAATTYRKALKKNSSSIENKNEEKNNNYTKETPVMKKEMIIDGMMCMHCSGRVEKVLNAIEGVEAKVELAKKTAFITCPEGFDTEILKKAVTDAGYTVLEIK